MAGPDVAVPAPSSPRTIRWTLLGVMLSMLLGMLGTTTVGTAMPTIVRDLGGFDARVPPIDATP